MENALIVAQDFARSKFQTCERWNFRVRFLRTWLQITHRVF